MPSDPPRARTSLQSETYVTEATARLTFGKQKGDPGPDHWTTVVPMPSLSVDVPIDAPS
jgi:hypothetical protein